MCDLQPKLSRSKAGRIVRIYKNEDFIFDDELYFNLINITLAGNDRFYLSNINLTERSIKNKEA